MHENSVRSMGLHPPYGGQNYAHRELALPSSSAAVDTAQLSTQHKNGVARRAHRLGMRTAQAAQSRAAC